MIRHRDRGVLAAAAALAAALLTPASSSVRAQALDMNETIVAISCEKPGTALQSQGSGVLVSPKGHVLTALHVVKDMVNCRGTRGYADPGHGDPLVMQEQSASADAALLVFSRPGPYSYVKYCRLEDWMIRREIYSAGFPRGTKTGVPSFRKGVLSTVTPVFGGVLETDSQTITGMSGGPVFASDLKSLIGIVVGAAFSPEGPSYYGILPTDKFRDQFNLIASERPCYHQSREIALPAAVKNWRPKKPGEAANDLPLGVLADEGVCFLSAVWGQMNDPRDTIRVEIKDGQYFLTGENMSGSEHGGDVRCIWHD